MKLEVRLSYGRIVVTAMALMLLVKLAGPQSSRANVEGNTTALIEALINMRASLDLYRAEHDGQLPATDSGVEFEKALTEVINGRGPYMKRIPANPFNGLDTIRFDGVPAGANKAGWRLDTKTGNFQADNATSYSAL